MNFDSPFIKIDFILLHDYNIYIIPVSSWLWIGAMFRLSEIMRKNFTYYKVKLNNEGDLNTHAIYSAKILPLLNPC